MLWMPRSGGQAVELKPRPAVIAAALGSLVIVLLVVPWLVASKQRPDVPASPSSTVSTSAAADVVGFPGADSTGVPPGTKLLPYYGPCGINQENTEIVEKTIDCDRLVIQAPGVRIVRSALRRIDLDTPDATVEIIDSTVDAGRSQAPAIGYQNVTLRRVEVRGGQTSVLCGTNCLIEDSWLHAQMEPVGEQHLGGFLSSGGSNVVLRHNRIECSPRDNRDGGGCTGTAQIFGDFGPLSDYTFDRNLFVATPGGYCASFGYNPGARFGDNPIRIRVVGNTFQRGANGKCGVWGPGTSFKPTGRGNVWRGNVWEDGKPVSSG